MMICNIRLVFLGVPLLSAPLLSVLLMQGLVHAETRSEESNTEVIPPAQAITIKVLLKEFPLTTEDTLTLSSPHGLMVSLGDGTHRSYYFKNSVSFSFKNKIVKLNGKKQIGLKPIRIQPMDGHLRYNQEDYFGSFFLFPHKDKLLLINKLKLEDYVYTVLRTESWPGWPLEVNKVFAITCRSYAIAKFLEARKKKLPYHIGSTNKHQTYGGIRHNDVHKRAIEQTEGVFLGYENKPAVAMFDSCCGGIIPANMDPSIFGIEFRKAPYLARKQACTYCKECKIYSWKTDIPYRELEKQLKKSHPRIGTVTDVAIGKRDTAGLVHELIITYTDSTGVSKKLNINGKIYKLFNSVKSFAYDITPKKHGIALRGTGFGHHLGLCQWGAWRMVVKDNWTYKRILKFFFPGTEFLKVTSGK